MVMRKHLALKKLLKTTLLGATALAVSGCMLNPYINYTNPTPEQVAEVQNRSLDHAIALAEITREKYREKIVDQTVLNNFTGNGLIALGATAIALAAYGAHPDKIIGAGLLGGLGFTLGQRRNNPNQDLVYLAGMQAMNCAILAVQPLRVTGDLEDQINTDLISATDKIVTLENAIGDVRNKIAVLRKEDAGNSLITDAERLIATSEKIASTANKASVTATKLRVALNGIGPKMIATINTLDAAVMKGVREAQPSLESVSTAVKGLAGAAGIFAPGIDFAALSKGLDDGADDDAQQESTPIVGKGSGGIKTAEQIAAEARIKAAEAGLKAAEDALRSKARSTMNTAHRLNAYAESIDSAKSTDSLKLCQVDQAPPFKVSDSLVTITEGTARTQTVVLSGGKPPYVARLTTLPADGLSVDSPLSDERTVTIRATNALKQGDYTVYIEDSAKASATVSVKVSPAQPTEVLDTQSSDAKLLTALKAINEALKPYADTPFSPDGIRPFTITAVVDEESKILAVDVTLQDGNATEPSEENVRLAILGIKDGDETLGSKYAADLGDPVQTILINGLTGEEESAPIVKVDRLPSVVEKLSKTEVKKIQQALCMLDGDDDGLWGPITQYKLKENRKPPKAGPLTQTERDEFLALSDADIANRCS